MATARQTPAGRVEQRVLELVGGLLHVEHGDFWSADEPRVTAWSWIAPNLARKRSRCRDSVFSVPEPMDSGAGYSMQGQVAAASCGTGEISGDRFDGVNLSLGVCSIPVVDNEFVDTARPLSVSHHDNLALVDLAGPGSNTFTAPAPSSRCTCGTVRWLRDRRRCSTPPVAEWSFQRGCAWRVRCVSLPGRLSSPMGALGSSPVMVVS